MPDTAALENFSVAPKVISQGTRESEERIEQMGKDAVILPENGKITWMPFTPSLFTHHWKHKEHTGSRATSTGYYVSTR
jgi:hypothetical protein